MSTHTTSRPQRQAGFILTIELILITTILIIGSIVGLVAIRDALFKRMVIQQSQNITVYDANATPLGEILGFDEHEAPLIAYVDRTVPPLSPNPDHRNYRALIGVRDDRFTSREPVYYDGANCTGTPCIKAISDEASDSMGVSNIANTGAVSYLHALQGGPNYAIGRSPDGITGFLYRSGPAVCPVEAEQIRSRYMSQRVVTGSPCESFTIEGETPADVSCLIDLSLVGEPCACSAGYVDQGDVLERNLPAINTLLDSTFELLAAQIPDLEKPRIGKACCPSGTKLEENEQLVSTVVYTALVTLVSDLGLDALVAPILSPLAGELVCVPDFTAYEAVSVQNPNNSALNALEGLEGPFQVNLPADVDTADSWISVPPDGEGINR